RDPTALALGARARRERAPGRDRERDRLHAGAARDDRTPRHRSRPARARAGRSATEALEVVTTLLETHGQAGSGHFHLDWPYHNAFLIADPSDAWILETSDRRWAARRVDAVGNVSNGLALGTAWERGSADVTSFAVERGWWAAERGRVDFAAAYADEAGVP